MKRPEILSPAGNFEKMKTAILYGADAVYLSGQIFGMRAAADNFSLDELAPYLERTKAKRVAFSHVYPLTKYEEISELRGKYQFEVLTPSDMDVFSI